MVEHPETLLEMVSSSRGSVVVDGARIAATDLVSKAATAAVGLRARGVGRGQGVVLVDDGDGVDVLAALLGAWWVGARPSIVAGTVSASELTAVRQQTGATLVVRGVAEPGDPAVAFADLRRTGPPFEPVCEPEDGALDVMSSGTTGRPKCVSFTHRALATNVAAIARRLELTQQDVLYSPLSLSIAGVVGMVLLPGLLAGSTVHLGRLSGAQVARAHKQLDTTQPTLVYGVPYLYEILAGRPGTAGCANLRWAICSSAPLPESTFHRAWQSLGTPVRSSYCLVEAGTVTLNTCTDVDALRTTVGEPVDGVEVRIVPLDDGDRVGRVVVGGNSCGSGYRNAGELTDFADGEVWTNDLGFLADGLLTITGRADEVIQVAGQNVDLARIRELVSHCPGLGDFAVIAGQHERLGRVPILVADGNTLRVPPRDVIAYCRSVLRDVEVPREVRVVDGISRTATGKVRLFDGEAE